MKVFSVIFVLVATFAVGAYTSNATYGNVDDYTGVISKQNVVVFPRIGQLITQDMSFPKNGQTNNRIITGILVLDHFANRTGATPTLRSGGPGFKYSTVTLKSYVSRGVNVTVTVYSKCK